MHVQDRRAEVGIRGEQVLWMLRQGGPEPLCNAGCPGLLRRASQSKWDLQVSAIQDVEEMGSFTCCKFSSMAKCCFTLSCNHLRLAQYYLKGGDAFELWRSKGAAAHLVNARGAVSNCLEILPHAFLHCVQTLTSKFSMSQNLEMCESVILSFT